MIFIIVKEKDSIADIYTLKAKEEYLKEKEWFYSKKMRRLKQQYDVTFNGKSMEYLVSLPYLSVLKKKKKEY
jgi:hypothetical protein